MKEILKITEVEHQLFLAPLTDHKVDRLKAYLNASNLKKNGTVIFDLTCNFASGPRMNTVDRRPMTTGKAKVKKYHLFDTRFKTCGSQCRKSRQLAQHDCSRHWLRDFQG